MFMASDMMLKGYNSVDGRNPTPPGDV